jgi:hypothetical protein
VAKGSVDHWQRNLDEDGTVVITSSRQTPALVLAGCIAVALLGLAIALSGSPAAIVVGVVIIASAAYWASRAVRTVASGQPHLVVTADDVTYGQQSVRWSAVTEIVRHSMTVRGNIQTYVWIIHGRERLRLPQSLQADMAELELWLRSVHSRRDATS